MQEVTKMNRIEHSADDFERGGGWGGVGGCSAGGSQRNVVSLG
jgi:hypothetical protein